MRFGLVVNVEGNGRVSSRDSGLDCRSTCRRRYADGAKVTLLARPAHGYWFTGWTGACEGRAPSCAVTMTEARNVRAHFAPKLALRLRVTAGLIYHSPYEHGVVHVLATWHGRPLAGARLRATIDCGGGRATFTRRTRRNGRVTLTYGTEMPNWIRIYNCPVRARVVANRLAATSSQAFLHFIHPLWLDARHGKDGKIIVRVWGRRGKLFELHAGEKIVGSGRIGPQGWVDVSPQGLRAGQRVWVRGTDGLASHMIVA